MKKIKIEDIFHVIRNGITIKQDKVVNGVPVTRIETIADGQIDLNRLGYASIKEHEYRDYYLQEGDILMSHINSISHLGKVAFVENLNVDIIHGMNLLCLKANPEKVLPKYAFYYFRSGLFLNDIKNITKKSVNQASFNISKLKLLEIPLIPIQQQSQLIYVLDKINTLITQRKKSIKLLDEFDKSVFIEMFGDPVNNENQYKLLPLNQFGKIVTGNTPPRSNIENYSSKHIEWLKTDNIVPNKLYATAAEEYLSEEGASKARIVTNGALLVACIAGSIDSIGRSALVNRPVSFNQQINAIQPNDSVNPFYLYWLFKLSNKYIQNHATKGMKKILTKGVFEKIKFPLPPIELQERFAKIVKETEVLREQYKQSLKELENLYKSTSQKAFNGELVLS